MKFKIDTEKMSYILSKVARGVGKKHTLPITECILLQLTDGVLQITSTNGINFVSVTDTVEGDSGECIVKADQLIKLVEKTTKKELSFSMKDTYIEVKGNGVYKVQTINEQFPSYEFDESVPSVTINTDILKRVFKVNESAIAKELILPYLTGYNVGESCITSDGIKMCINNTTITEERVLITQALADLISTTMTSDTVSVQKEGNKMLICSENITIFGTELDGLDKYPNISGILAFEFDNKASVSKQELLSVIDRLSLFVDQFDNNGIRVKFGTENIEIEDLKISSQETLDYVDKLQTEPIEILLNIDFLQDILSAVSADVVTIQYSSKLPVIKIEEEPVTLILGTMNAV